jgi:hypothetical protein
MVGQSLDLLDELRVVGFLDGRYDQRVECAPTLAEEAFISDVMGKSVLEGVSKLREESRLVEELCGA